MSCTSLLYVVGIRRAFVLDSPLNSYLVAGHGEVIALYRASFFFFVLGEVQRSSGSYVFAKKKREEKKDSTSAESAYSVGMGAIRRESTREERS